MLLVPTTEEARKRSLAVEGKTRLIRGESLIYGRDDYLTFDIFLLRGSEFCTVQIVNCTLKYNFFFLKSFGLNM